MNALPTTSKWYRDPIFWTFLALAMVLRALPMLIWGWEDTKCMRDECIYRTVAEPLLSGDPIKLAPKGWLPAPGFAYFIAACKAMFGSFESAKWIHWLLTLPTLAIYYTLGGMLSGRRAARIITVLLALHPTLSFFVGTLWTETIYTFLLGAISLGILKAREGKSWVAIVTGVLLGCTILFRGVATYMLPILSVVLLLPDEFSPSLWHAWKAQSVPRRRGLIKQAALFAVATVLTVAPYSISASKRFHGFVITDATLGHVAALGNNTYDPVTFDYLIGQLTGPLYTRTLRSGRPDCPQNAPALEHDKCEKERSVAWARKHPGAFLQRIPTRIAQLVNPNTFLTRHLRWNKYPGMSWGLRNGLVLYQILYSFGVIVFGTFLIGPQLRKHAGLLTAGIIAYNFAVVSALYGISRFRLPYEPLWILMIALALAKPTEVRAWMKERPKEALGFALVAGLLAWLCSWYALSGFPGFYT